VYNIEYTRSAQGPTMKLYCYEVADEWFNSKYTTNNILQFFE
jgi:hypothetical protein